MMLKVLIFLIFWIIGGVINLLTWDKIHDYKDYENPKFFLVLGIFLSFAMSWCLIYLTIMTNQFEIPKWIYHNCLDCSKITFKEEYLDKNGKETDYEHSVVHHTYKIYTCQYCGKIAKIEQLQ